MPEKLRVAIAGLDHWYSGLMALEGARDSSRIEFVAIAHRDAAKAEATARRFGVPEWTTDYTSVTQRSDVDVVVTSCYVSENRALCEAAASAGKHIVSVKPIAMNVGEADAIVAAVKKAGVHFFSFESAWRIWPVYRRVQEWVAAGRIGPVVSAFCVMRSPLPLTPWSGEHGPTWWLDASKSPGGGWIDHSIYMIDYLRWLLEDEVGAVSGEIANVKYRDLPFEDFGIANLIFKNGVRTTLEVTWTGAPGAGLTQIHLVGRDGQILYDPTVTGRLAAVGDFGLDGWVQTTPPPGARAVLDHFADVVQGKIAPIATAEDARNNLAAGMAFYEAARAGRRLVVA